MNTEEKCETSDHPKTKKEAGVLFIKGLLMGTADIIPGVSGGTIALICGIYHDLLAAIQSFNAKAVTALFRFDIKTLFATVNFRFLLTLGAGIGIAIITLAHPINYLLEHQRPSVYSLFFGLITASVFILGKTVDFKHVSTVLSFIIGSVGAFFIVGLIPTETPNALPVIFVSGFVAICAMILPGISGAFILLILGKYTYITGMLKNPFIPENLLVIIVFSAGCATGLMAFSRFLTWLLDHYYQITLALLTGFMCGSLRKIWPWKEIELTDEKGHILIENNLIPSVDTDLLPLHLLLIVVGFIVVILIDSFAKKSERAQ